jgi:hypothetical protein
MTLVQSITFFCAYQQQRNETQRDVTRQDKTQQDKA